MRKQNELLSAFFHPLHLIPEEYCAIARPRLDIGGPTQLGYCLRVRQQKREGAGRRYASTPLFLKKSRKAALDEGKRSRAGRVWISAKVQASKNLQKSGHREFSLTFYTFRPVSKLG
jgi:hypothetical protein